MSTRRKFLFHCTTLALAASTAPQIALSTSARAATRTAAGLGFNEFSAQVSRSFMIGGVPMKLVKAQFIPAGGNSTEQFSLLFRAANNVTLADNAFPAENSELGRFQMFITRARTEDVEHTYYRAEFNLRPMGSHPIPARAARLGTRNSRIARRVAETTENHV